jgi:membrane-bound serine protease (ClpP class)
MKVIMRFLTSILVFWCVLGSLSVGHSQDNKKPKVLLVKINAEIDARMNRYTTLAFEKAEEINADYVVIEMDTYGGALNDADDIRTRILNYEKPVFVWINKDAASAGALISIACDSIYMTKGASIGAATVVVADGTAAPDKYQSYMRSIMRSTAEAKGRDPKIAEAMVDQNLSVDSISTAGQVITFSTSEAIKFGYCEAQANSLDEVMLRSGVVEYDLEKFELSNTEKIIALFLNPFISGILILIILGGIYFELQTPGVGFPIIASIIAIVLYFVPYYLNGLAENWEIIVFFLGVLLLILEIFVIPGFGVPGIAGIILMVGSLILVMINNDSFDFSGVRTDDIVIATATTLLGLFGAIVLMFAVSARIGESSFFKRVALMEIQDKDQGYVSNSFNHTLIGQIGKSYTVLRPAGKVIVEGQLYDATTRGNYIEKDTDVTITAVEGSVLRVKEAAV